MATLRFGAFRLRAFSGSKNFSSEKTDIFKLARRGSVLPDKTLQAHSRSGPASYEQCKSKRTLCNPVRSRALLRALRARQCLRRVMCSVRSADVARSSKASKAAGISQMTGAQNGHQSSVCATITDMRSSDPTKIIKVGRCCHRLDGARAESREDLLELAHLR